MVPTTLRSAETRPKAMSLRIYSICVAGSVLVGCLLSTEADLMAWLVLVIELTMLEKALWMAETAVELLFRMLVNGAFSSGKAVSVVQS